MSWPELHPERVRMDYLSAERFIECCDQVWSTDRRSFRSTDRGAPRHGELIYAKRDHVAPLFSKLKKRRNKIVLVTSESDDAVETGATVIPQVAAWFSTNALHPHIKPIPLGLGNSYCRVTAKAGLLADFGNREKKSLLYVNFRPETNPGIRRPLWESFGSTGWAGCCTRHPGNVSREEYVASMASHRFVLCPRGNGIDTHRMWEALYLGVIPIIEKNPALESFSDLPILLVDRLEGLEPSFLESKYQVMVSRAWNWEKLFLPWWRRRLDETKGRVPGKVPVAAHCRSRAAELMEAPLRLLGKTRPS